MAKFDKRLGNIAVKHKLITKKKLTEVMEVVDSNGKTLSEMLIDEGLVDERTLIGCVSLEMDLPPIDLEKVSFDGKALDLLPQDLAKYYGVLPVSKIGNILTMAVSNPTDVLKLDDVKIVTGCDIRAVVSTDRAITSAIDRAYRGDEQKMEAIFENVVDPELELAKDNEDEELDLNAITDESGESPVVRLVNLVIYEAIKEHASDIHIEAFEKKTVVRYRTDGTMRETITPPKAMHNSIVSRLKIMANLDIAEKFKPQDGKFQMKVEGRQIDFRVSILPCIHGEKVVLRLLDSSNLALSLETLGFEEKCLDDFKKAIASPYGMVLVTGPTGSGKSTTLYSSLTEILSPKDNIVTVEDPVEYQLEGVNQVPVNPKRGLTFAGALRSILRQDPDIIMIGEIRDLETVEIAIKAALTGHLVFSTLHTNDAPGTISRMIDMGVDPFMVASATVLVSAQRLAKKLCDACKEPVEIPTERLVALGAQEKETKGATLFKAVGCPKCVEGYKGRFALLETLPMSEDVKRIIIDGKSALDIKKQSLEEGMITLRRCGLLNAMRGKTSLEEILRVTMGD